MTDTMQGLNKEQLDAVQTINGPMLILAGAGSGKTKVKIRRGRGKDEVAPLPYCASAAAGRASLSHFGDYLYQ